jgi:hypothetical protein
MELLYRCPVFLIERKDMRLRKKVFWVVTEFELVGG